ncbi:helix-turn-helix domain-containing protein [Fulvivirga kasyanovii]|uniref:Helix-turn-helix domain-containing protein n=1 Tax=Fulvivirga kasyanovii TaxID=396812 RepID=A0ABW9RHZ2_9BACT|nr:helix-turn-helix domain-containing protein [Fulvivirga kasyanovii]MTI23678.1 helix-turn-helix domain-containing protein [Fulvivirga kasyanovii]
MNFLSRIERIDELIRSGATGNAAALASRLNVSKRTVFNDLKWMREKGAPIFYSTHYNGYRYGKEVVFVVAFVSPDIRNVMEYM